ncbi:hypothetical protein PEX1_048770 [Penicillium expansum]|uniref:Uncharacterized protein n=1 Tax=Penicillium expansum TaxID=27334 RepID=A0A0A2JAS9_PENEN|nr:hypothetical protein PEX2_099020 [Penicillium expansum]KGO48921.1 hypothetical protein PEXP_009700 [Penicillium expansum]KGO51109.1 hypothetical protein PEX1_048770 [Penicillium expansum]KGO51728.1 hypothetical protein PEX2_099020 [Penicillium expansum]
MDIRYFLEIFDLKHRHGSNLCSYHTYWRKSLSNKNFFYWLEGDGQKKMDLPLCSQDLRKNISVISQARKVELHGDETGLLRWAKNNELDEQVLFHGRWN